MKLTLEELQALRSTLTAHRLKHEMLVTQMQVLRQNCRELRAQIASSRQAGGADRTRAKFECDASSLAASG